MKCPRCSIGDISSHTLECLVCGFVPVGGVLTEAAILADLDPQLRSVVEVYIQPLAVLQRTAYSLLCFAEERETERRVLLKVLLPHATDAPQVAARFEREFERIAPLAHAHLVSVRRFGTSATACWYTRDHASGQTLAEFTTKQGPLDAAQSIRVAAQAASVLDYLHRRGITHGNLKPGNLILDPRGTLRVSDAGIGRVWGGAPREDGAAAVEALAYAAPEYFVAGGALGPKADQYGLAAVLFQALAGRPPQQGRSMEELAAAHREAPVPSILALRPELPKALDDALQRALAKQPSARFAGIMEFAAAVAGPGASDPGRAAPIAPLPAKMQQVLVVEPTPEAPVPQRRFPWWIVAVALIVVGAAAWTLFERSARVDMGSVTLNPPLPNDLVSTFAGESVPPAPPAAGPAAGRDSAPPARAAPAPPAPPVIVPGHLFVNCTPWATLSIDGSVIGNTPTLDVAVTPGHHHLVLTHDGFQPYETVITVAPGQTLRLTDITLQLAP